jgi:hypothetical protein
MLFAITIHGGSLIMMGQHFRSESLFYYFRIEDQVPENHFTSSHRSAHRAVVATPKKP